MLPTLLRKEILGYYLPHFSKVRKLTGPQGLGQSRFPASWLVPLVLLLSGHQIPSEQMKLAGLLFQVCLRLPRLGLQLIDPLLLKHPAIDPPRERKKKKNGKKIN